MNESLYKFVFHKQEAKSDDFSEILGMLGEYAPQTDPPVLSATYNFLIGL